MEMQTLEEISMACLRKSCNQLCFSASGQPYFIYIATEWFSSLKGRVRKHRIIHFPVFLHISQCCSIKESLQVQLIVEAHTALHGKVLSVSTSLTHTFTHACLNLDSCEEKKINYLISMSLDCGNTTQRILHKILSCKSMELLSYLLFCFGFAGLCTRNTSSKMYIRSKLRNTIKNVPQTQEQTMAC